MADDRCKICGQESSWSHDHKDDLSGLDDGPPLVWPRKKPAPKSAFEMAGIRAKAWETRRGKWGAYGHR